MIARGAPSGGRWARKWHLAANRHNTCGGPEHVARAIHCFCCQQHVALFRFLISFSFFLIFKNRCFHFILGNFTTYDSGFALGWMEIMRLRGVKLALSLSLCRFSFLICSDDDGDGGGSARDDWSIPIVSIVERKTMLRCDWFGSGIGNENIVQESICVWMGRRRGGGMV